MDFTMNGTVAVLRRQVTELTDDEISALKQVVYQSGVVVLKEQFASASEFVRFGLRIGELIPYYEEMYRHPEHKEIFISSNCPVNGQLFGVPSTGKFWHSDYAFMQRPFAFTITYPQVVSSQDRGTYFIDMAQAYASFPSKLKTQLVGAIGTHSVQHYFKIRPTDIYRPIGEIIAEIDRNTPEVKHPTVIRHPVTDALILYIGRGFTKTKTLRLADDSIDAAEMLHHLLVETGQTDENFSHPNIKLLTINEGDIIIWDNRRFIHHAKHNAKVEPTCTFRLTAYDSRKR